jgi:hypothetical protein
MKGLSRCLLLAAIAIVFGPVGAQTSSSQRSPYDGEFFFARLAYQSAGGGRGRSYTTDYPYAEQHLLAGVRRLTRIDVAGDIIVEPGSPDLMDYPWLYAVEVGHWYLDDFEAGNLREYLLRGGFLMVDDFHGSDEWLVFQDSMRRVFPDRPIIDIPDDDVLIHLHYDLNKDIQIPGVQFLRSGRTYENDGYTPYWGGIYDDQGRLMVAINFNMDMGDAWEHADNPQYPEPMTGLAYRFAINYVIYAMTH